MEMMFVMGKRTRCCCQATGSAAPVPMAASTSAEAGLEKERPAQGCLLLRGPPLPHGAQGVVPRAPVEEKWGDGAVPPPLPSCSTDPSERLPCAWWCCRVCRGVCRAPHLPSAHILRYMGGIAPLLQRAHQLCALTPVHHGRAGMTQVLLRASNFHPVLVPQRNNPLLTIILCAASSATPGRDKRRGEKRDPIPVLVLLWEGGAIALLADGLWREVLYSTLSLGH